jgi:helicase
VGFRGLFIGIDRHASDRVQDLTCASRDATALAALFGDTLGGTVEVLSDEQATRATIEQRLEALSGSDPDDMVVIAFSGHGTEDHRLVTFDTDPRSLDETALALSHLQQLFAAIPARRLMLILDCCFAGGMGAKVLSVEARPRDMASVEARLSQIAGDGRVIITASGPTEPAWEHTRQGHGLLTAFLIEALTGADEVLDSGRIPILGLLAHVTERVKAASLAIGRTQTPTVRGVFDGDLTWPRFEKGQRWAEAFPDRKPMAVSAEIASLAAAGFPAALLDAWAKAIPSLNALQIAAVNEYGLLDGEHLVVSAPTSSGKTMIGELAALKMVLARRRAIFLLPLKALVADKRRHFQRVYDAFGVRTFEATGDTDDIGPLLRGKYDIALLTYEKFAGIALAFPHVLEQAGVVVVDEAQMIADKGRGANLEFLLTLVRMRRGVGIEPQIIALSAVIGDTNGFEDWLGARLLRRSERPVPLDEGLLLADGSFRHLQPGTGEEVTSGPLIQRIWQKDSSQDWVIPLVAKLVAEGQQVIVFREQKGQARGCAGYLAGSLGLPPATAAIERLPSADPSRASEALRTALAGGVAFHHSDLTPDERQVIEEEFRSEGSGLRVIAATTTLAMGLNTPASSVVICGLEHPGPTPYSVAEYKNLVGRAGRLGYAERGTSYLLALTPRDEHDLWQRYVTAAPEDLHSRFLDPDTDPRSLIVRVIASAARSGAQVTRHEVIAFLEASFGAFQQAQVREGWRWDAAAFLRALGDLIRHGLVEEDAAGSLVLTDLGRVAGESGAEVVSVLRFVHALHGLAADAVTDPTLIAVVQTARELDDVYFPMNKRSVKSHHKEPQTWNRELELQGVPWSVRNALQFDAAEEHYPTLRAKKAASSLLFVSGRAMADIEAALTQFGGGSDGAAGAVRSIAARTCDLLPTAARVAEVLVQNLDLEVRVERLLLRLTHGVSGEAVDLARESGAALSRGDYCKLTRAGLADVEAVDQASDEALQSALDTDAKVKIVREAAAQARDRRQGLAPARLPILNPYVG